MEVLEFCSRNAACTSKRQLDHAAPQQIATPDSQRVLEPQPPLSDKQCDLPKGMAETARPLVPMASSATWRADKPMRATAWSIQTKQ